LQVFQLNIQFPAAILEKRQEIFGKNFHRFVAQPYLGKVTKALPYIPSGYGAALKKPAWGVILPPRWLYEG
jgi:hypothetical protein